MSSLPVPSPWSQPLPEAAPPSDLAVHQLPTGTYETRAAFAVQGGSLRDKRHFAATAVLVQHPRGDLLIDAGFGRGVAAHVASLPRLARASFEAGRTASEQLDDAGYDHSRLLGVLVTHSHWDHVSGLDGLQVPIWIISGRSHRLRRDPDRVSTIGDSRSSPTRAAGMTASLAAVSAVHDPLPVRPEARR